MAPITPSTRKTSYAPVTPTTAFPVNFPLFDNADLLVTVNDVERTDYTVSGTYVDGVSTNAVVNMDVGVTGEVIIYGKRAPARTDQFSNGPLPINNFNYALNRLTIENQEARRDIDQNAADIAQEIVDRGDAVAQIQANLNAETSARIVGDSALGIRVDNEITDRRQADTALASLIGQGGPINVPMFDTLLAASLATISPTINTVYTGGYSVPGDGGGALYRRVATQPTHAAKFQSADGAWWEIVPASVIFANSLGFSAASTGDANRIALQAAIDYAGTQLQVILTGKYVIVNCDVGIKQGIYSVSGSVSLYTGVRIIGSGQSNTKLNHTGGGVDFIVYTSSSITEFLFNSWVMDLTINGAGKTTSDTLAAIRVSRGSGDDTNGLAIYACGVERCFITNCYDGIGIKNSWTFEIRNCEMFDLGRSFVRGENITAVKIIGGRYDQAGEDGFYVTYANGGALETIALHIDHATIQSCQQRAVYGVDADHVMIDHSYIEANNKAGGYPAVEFASVTGTNAEMYSFTGCWFSPTSGNTGQPAVLIAKARMVSAHGVYIRGNAFSTGFSLGSGVEGYDIDGEFNGGQLVTVDPNTTGKVTSRVSLSLAGVDSEVQTLGSTSSSVISNTGVRIQEIDCTSAGKAFTLQDAHLQPGRRFTVQKADGGSNGLAIGLQSGSTALINGANASVTSTAAFARAEILCGYVAGTSTPCWFVKFT